MPTRSHGRNVGQRSANVSRFTPSADAKLTRFGAAMAILLRKRCTFAIQRTGSQLRFECNCEILVGASRAPPRLPCRNVHASSFIQNKGTLTPSSRRRLLRHHRHFLCRRLRLPLRLLPRRAVVEGGHRQTDQKGLSRGILDVFCSCPMVRLVTRGKRGDSENDLLLELG